MTTSTNKHFNKRKNKMVISEKDQKSFCQEYGYLMANHVEGDKTLEERLYLIEIESIKILRGMKEYGVKEYDSFYQSLKEAYPRMKEDIKKFYK